MNKQVIFSPDGVPTNRAHTLSLIDEAMKNDLKRLREIVLQLEACGGDFSASDVVGRLTESLNRNTISGYAAIAAARLRESGQDRTARAYRSAARSLTAFNGGSEVLLSEIDSACIAAYENYLMNKGLKMNTVSFYLRNLRAIYFRAVAEKLISRQTVNPFAGMHTGVYETKRRALDDDQIKALAALDEILSENGGKHEANERRKVKELRDSLMLFLFCFLYRHNPSGRIKLYIEQKYLICFPAYEGVIGYDLEQKDLNLEGRGVMLYFKYGGIIGTYAGSSESPHYEWHGGISFAFNPTNIAISAYNDFPTPVQTNQSTIGIISVFHTKDGIAKGNGDPCRLVGLTAAQVKAALSVGELPDNKTQPNILSLRPSVFLPNHHKATHKLLQTTILNSNNPCEIDMKNLYDTITDFLKRLFRFEPDEILDELDDR